MVNRSIHLCLLGEADPNVVVQEGLALYWDLYRRGEVPEMEIESWVMTHSDREGGHLYFSFIINEVAIYFMSRYWNMDFIQGCA